MSSLLFVLELRPDQLPVVRAKVLASHSTLGRSLDCGASLDWHRPNAICPLADELGRQVEDSRELRLSTSDRRCVFA